VLQRYEAQKEKEQAKATQDQTSFLRCVHKHTGKQNRHNVGMVE